MSVDMSPSTVRPRRRRPVRLRRTILLVVSKSIDVEGDMKSQWLEAIISLRLGPKPKFNINKDSIDPSQCQLSVSVGLSGRDWTVINININFNINVTGKWLAIEEVVVVESSLNRVRLQRRRPLVLWQR
jgi:hypothetical protein